MEDVDADEEDDGISGTTSPGPKAIVCNREILKTNSAM